MERDLVLPEELIAPGSLFWDLFGKRSDSVFIALACLRQLTASECRRSRDTEAPSDTARDGARDQHFQDGGAHSVN